MSGALNLFRPLDRAVNRVMGRANTAITGNPNPAPFIPTVQAQNEHNAVAVRQQEQINQIENSYAQAVTQAQTQQSVQPTITYVQAPPEPEPPPPPAPTPNTQITTGTQATTTDDRRGNRNIRVNSDDTLDQQRRAVVASGGEGGLSLDPLGRRGRGQVNRASMLGR